MGIFVIAASITKSVHWIPASSLHHSFTHSLEHVTYQDEGLYLMSKRRLNVISHGVVRSEIILRKEI